MRNKELKLKYKAMEHLVEDMECLVDLGFAEYVVDPDTGKDGWKITPEGLKLLENYQEVNETSIS